VRERARAREGEEWRGDEPGDEGWPGVTIPGIPSPGQVGKLVAVEPLEERSDVGCFAVILAKLTRDEGYLCPYGCNS